MYSLLFILLCLFCGTAHADVSHDKLLMRDLIIVLDDEQATNPNKNWAAICDFQNALDSEAAPILFNESLWHTFVDARQEWLLQAQIPGTDEYKCTALRNQINERANYWYDILSENGGDDIHIRALMGDKVNEEFYTKESYERLRSSGIIPSSITSPYVDNMRHCATIPYSFDRWYWFYLEMGYYVAIPKRYCEQHTNSTDLVEIMKAVGFNTSVASHRVDPLVVEPTFKATLSDIDTTIIPVLKELLCKKSSVTDNYSWNIKIHGHGAHWKRPQEFIQEVAGLTIERFKELCIFFDDHLLMHMIYVISCHAGGINRLHLTDDGITYTYPIVIACLGDNITMSWRFAYDLLPNGKLQCKGYHFKKNADTHRWELFHEPSQRYRRFFERLHEIENVASTTDYASVQDTLFNAFVAVNRQQDTILAIPQLLIPNSSRWLLCYEDTMTYLDTQSALLAEVCNIIQPIRTRYILIDAPVLKSGLQIVDKSVESIIMMAPGDTTHYCRTLQAPAYFTDELLRSFWSKAYTPCTKQLLCDEIICQADPKDPLIQMLGITEKTVPFKDVLMRIVKNEQIELAFTAPNGDVFYATYREVDGKPMVRNLQKLSTTATASYRTHYDKTKTELLAKTDEEYAPLRNHYLQAMKKDQKEEQAAVA